MGCGVLRHVERALGDPGVGIRGHGALPGCPHGGPVPSAPPCVPPPGWDTRGLLGGCRIWPPVPAALCWRGNFGFHGRDESAAGHQNPKQPGAPASPGCARRVGGVQIRVLFIYFNTINEYFSPLCRSHRGLQDAARRWGAWAARRSPTRKSLAGRGWGGRNPIPIPPARRREPSAALPGACCCCCPRPGGPGRGGCTPCPPRFLRRRGRRRLLFVSGALRSALPAAAPSRRELGTSRSLVPRGPDPSILLLLLPTRRRKAWGCAPCRGLCLVTVGAVGRAETRCDGRSGGNPKASPGAGAGTRKRRSLVAPALPGLKISWRC